ncbi:hypothetical protein ED733_008901 [Metarhizium rileyi]|uniref:Uncharacterized protein n=1 Tax=Metarhizium rileyi (strain RCEF 4871) TaxID=1649241 RepID=A0A5C6GQ95_METRR|nr:hypothetical protein ED733_008901 [Metarhizium rileyi]
MLLPSLITLIFPAAATSLILPRQHVRPNACCFTLHDAANGQIVRQQTGSGFLYLGGSRPTGWYCIDLALPEILYDAFNNACFLNPDEVFQCFDPTRSDDDWGIKQSEDDVLIFVNGSSRFKVCPTESGDLIYSNLKKDARCRGLTLKAMGLKGSCGSLRG